MRINKKHLHLCQPLRIIPKKNTQLKKKKQKAKKAIGKSKCKTRSPNKCKEKATVLEKAKKSKRKSKCKKNGKRKKRRKKSKQQAKKKVVLFCCFSLFFQKYGKKQKKASPSLHFPLHSFIFVFACFSLHSKVWFPGVHFWIVFYCCFVYAGSGWRKPTSIYTPRLIYHHRHHHYHQQQQFATSTFTLLRYIWSSRHHQSADLNLPALHTQWPQHTVAGAAYRQATDEFETQGLAPQRSMSKTWEQLAIHAWM